MAVAIFWLVLKRVWRDLRDSRNGGHCLLTVGGKLRGVKIGAECVKYAWLSCNARPSRWALCISMQWPRLKGCHVACDECASGEICSHQHVGYQLGAAANFDDLVKFGDRRQIRRFQMFIKLAFEFGCDVILMSHPITWSLGSKLR